VLGDDDEHGEVDGVDAFAEDGPLPAALPAHAVLPSAEEGGGVLEVVAGDDAAEGLARLEHLAVAGVDRADLPLPDGDPGDFGNVMLPRPRRGGEAPAEDFAREAAPAVHRDDPAPAARAGRRPELLDDADAVVGDVAQPRQLA